MGAGLEDGDGGLEAGDGGAELVGGVAEEPFLARDVTGEAVGHLIDGGGQLPQFVGAREVQPGVEPAGGDFRRLPRRARCRG